MFWGKIFMIGHLSVIIGGNEFHLAVVADDFDEAYAHHKEMDCICYENKPMGIYFIMDPDGYWIEIIPRR